MSGEKPDEDEEEAVPEVVLTPEELSAGLLAAAKLGRRNVVVRTLRVGADINAVDVKGWTALHWASYLGHWRVAELLLQNGAADKYKSDMEASANDPSAPRIRVVDSPLHLAVHRGHLRVVYLLLAAGYSVADVDEMGNNCIHLACATTCPVRSVQLELLKTIMCSGFDPDARNWLGQKAVELLPSDAHDASKLLASAEAQTQCASTSTPFGADQHRFLCYSTHKFFCEEASVSTSVRAYAPCTPDVTVPSDGLPVHGVGRRFGWSLGHSSLPIASSPHDLHLSKPVRFGADVSYRVADAEAGVETCLNPMIDQLTASGAHQGIDVTAVLAASGSGKQAGGASGTAAIDLITGLHSPSSSSSSSSSGFRPLDIQRGVSGSIEEEDGAASPDERQAGAAATSSSSKRAGSAEDPAVRAAREQLASSIWQPELYLTPGHIASLESAVGHARDLHADVQVVARGMTVLRRLQAAAALRDAVAVMQKKRPLADAAAGAAGVEAAIASATAAGVGPTLVAQARLDLRVAYAEASLQGSIALCSSIPVGTHFYDADIQRLSLAVGEAEGASAAASRVEAGTGAAEDEDLTAEQAAASAEGMRRREESQRLQQQQERAQAKAEAARIAAETAAAEGVAEGDGVAEGKEEDVSAPAAAAPPVSADGDSAADASEPAAATATEEPAVDQAPSKPATRLLLPALPANTIRLSPVAAAILDQGRALLSRLQCEVGVTDAVAAAEARSSEVAAAAEVHKEEDPTLLPTPEKPVDPAAEAAAAAAAARPPSGKGKPAAAAARPASGKGKAAAPADAEAPPPAPLDPSFPCDSAGTPMPDSPQLIAIKALRDQCAALEATIVTSKTAGADAACIASAEASLARLRQAMVDQLTSERTRVEFYRAERAKLDKKNKKKGKKK